MNNKYVWLFIGLVIGAYVLPMVIGSGVTAKKSHK